MTKEKGFTLVELLATIVVLSVIALIATPIIINVIEKAKKGALVSSVNGLVESANMYYTNEIIKGDINEDIVFDFEEGTQTSESKLSYKGKVYNGKLILTSDSDVITCIDDGKYYAYKEKNSDEVISGIGTCLYDGTTGDFTIESDVDVIIKECEEDKKEIQDQITSLTTTVNSLQQTINEKEQAISDLTSAKEGLENQVTTFEGEKEDLLKQIENSNLSNSELNTKISKLEGTIDTLESSIEAKNNEIAVLNGEKEDLQTELTTKTNELATLNENLGKVTAGASDVLSGKTILTSSGLVTGSMTNNGSVSKTLNAGGSYTIPKGYHDGTGKVTANTLASQTKVDSGKTAITASQVLSGYQGWANGNKVTGTMTNKAGTTTTATTITESGDNALITIPANGYYSTSSKISVPIETIKSNINVGSSYPKINSIGSTSSGLAINFDGNANRYVTGNLQDDIELFKTIGFELPSEMYSISNYDSSNASLGIFVKTSDVLGKVLHVTGTKIQQSYNQIYVGYGPYYYGGVYNNGGDYTSSTNDSEITVTVTNTNTYLYILFYQLKDVKIWFT